MPVSRTRPEAALVLADGEVFLGEAAGPWPSDGPPATGEVVFHTGMSGYQEILTDPSYAGQIIAFTYPHIGNYGTTPADDESRRAFCRGAIVRELTERPSNWRSRESLGAFLERQGVPALVGIDTRRLTRHLRTVGAVPGAFGPTARFSVDELARAAAAEPGTLGRDLVGEVTTGEAYTVGDGPHRVVAYDFGLKRSILVRLTPFATVEVVPARTPAAEVVARRPDGVFLSNGPGDPAALDYATEAVAELLGQVPVFGICLGHQLLARALGADTYRLEFGHHGANHPVRDLATDTVEITSQNHNYAVRDTGLDEAEPTHVNLNDGVLEGLAGRRVPAFSVQYHPEAGPGPHDAAHLFDRFRRLMGVSV